MVAARIQGPFVKAGRSHEPARIAASSHGGLAMLAIVYFPLRGDTKVVSGLASPRNWPYHEALIGYQMLIRMLVPGNWHYTEL
jgi:hypothetical protein